MVLELPVIYHCFVPILTPPCFQPKVLSGAPHQSTHLSKGLFATTANMDSPPSLGCSLPVPCHLVSSSYLGAISVTRSTYGNRQLRHKRLSPPKPPQQPAQCFSRVNAGQNRVKSRLSSPAGPGARITTCAPPCQEEDALRCPGTATTSCQQLETSKHSLLLEVQLCNGP